jgi:hypothetical protein
LPPIPDAVKNQVAAATGIIVEAHREGTAERHLTSCSGTLIAADLFLTARHCLNERSGEDLRSSSVTFDYATACDRTRPAGHVTASSSRSSVAAGGLRALAMTPVATDWVIVRLTLLRRATPPLQMRDAALMNGEVIFAIIRTAP